MNISGPHARIPTISLSPNLLRFSPSSLTVSSRSKHPLLVGSSPFPVHDIVCAISHPLRRRASRFFGTWYYSARPFERYTLRRACFYGCADTPCLLARGTFAQRCEYRRNRCANSLHPFGAVFAAFTLAVSLSFVPFRAAVVRRRAVLSPLPRDLRFSSSCAASGLTGDSQSSKPRM